MTHSDLLNLGTFWNAWLWVSLAIPIFYALDCILDVFFVGKRIYRNPVHASILSGLFAGILIIVFLPNHKSFEKPEFEIMLMALSSGIFYFLHVFFYFKALFKLNDASNLEIFLGFSVVLVPVLAFLLLNQRLVFNQYLGIGIALIGVVILCIASAGRGVFTSCIFRPHLNSDSGCI